MECEQSLVRDTVVITADDDNTDDSIYVVEFAIKAYGQKNWKGTLHTYNIVRINSNVIPFLVQL